MHESLKWAIDAEWPDGTIEQIKTFSRQLHAVDGLLKPGGDKRRQLRRHVFRRLQRNTHKI